MSLSRPLKSLKIRLFSTFQILENCYQIRKKTLTVWKFQTIKVILYSKLHFMFSHDFFISLAESFALKLDKTICPVICPLFELVSQEIDFCNFNSVFATFHCYIRHISRHNFDWHKNCTQNVLIYQSNYLFRNTEIISHYCIRP